MTIAIILTVYLCSVYGFALFLYDGWVQDKSPSSAPDWLIHLLVVLFSIFWPVTIGILSIIRVFKKA